MIIAATTLAFAEQSQAEYTQYDCAEIADEDLVATEQRPLPPTPPLSGQLLS
ncbi:MAG: hypothetical protein OSB69_07210 [Alphaproteobacteria bacterium]|nr:hypothetical protein [Alphaproteobacteria bacterium]